MLTLLVLTADCCVCDLVGPCEMRRLGEDSGETRWTLLFSLLPFPLHLIVFFLRFVVQMMKLSMLMSTFRNFSWPDNTRVFLWHGRSLHKSEKGGSAMRTQALPANI
ncbi:hypothetical protein PMAYCL1PPCAC_12224, partial [Pristionchus mayeri]